MSGDAELGNHTEEEAGFLLDAKQPESSNKSNASAFGNLLTREDLKRIDAEEPVWRRARIILLALFWILWIALLVASVVLIVLSPKCPPRPTLKFWQSKTAYWVNPFAFADSNGDLIGDLQGLSNKLHHIKDVVGAGFVILSSLSTGQFSNEKTELGLTTNFTGIDPVLGTISDFNSMVKLFHKNGLEVVLSFDFSTIAITHPWTKRPSYLRRFIEGELSRDGSESSVLINGTKYYSVGSKNTVNVDLMNPEVRDNIKKILKYWLNQGVDGVLLSNTAFYAAGSGDWAPDLNTNSSNRWFSQYPSSQLFSNNSLDFVAFVRKVIEEDAGLSGRAKLLVVDAGNIGYGLSNGSDYALRFLGNNGSFGAHLVIGRHFVKNRGWKECPNFVDWQQSTIRSYNDASDDQKDFIGLLTASTSDVDGGDIVSLASTLLLPGTPILYYGSELATQFNPSLQSPTALFPKGKVPFPNLTPQDSVLACQLPMPWDRSGHGFSSSVEGDTFSAYLKCFNMVETIESALSIGRSATPFHLVKQLVALRREPSLLWGEFEMFNRSELANTDRVELFIRRAEGFPAFIVALIKEVPNYGGVFDFSKVCDSIIPRVVYPPVPELALNKTVKSSRIFLKTDEQSAVYVFACSKV